MKIKITKKQLLKEDTELKNIALDIAGHVPGLKRVKQILSEELRGASKRHATTITKRLKGRLTEAQISGDDKFLSDIYQHWQRKLVIQPERAEQFNIKIPQIGDPNNNVCDFIEDQMAAAKESAEELWALKKEIRRLSGGAGTGELQSACKDMLDLVNNIASSLYMYAVAVTRCTWRWVNNSSDPVSVSIDIVNRKIGALWDDVYGTMMGAADMGCDLKLSENKPAPYAMLEISRRRLKSRKL